MKKYRFYPFIYKGLVLEDKNRAVIKTDMGHYCGYVVINKTKIPKKWNGDYDADALQYLNIHGGITYCEIEKNYVVFGLDCMHLDDDTNPKMKDPKYVMKLTEQMEQQILDYAKNYKKWKKYGKKRRIALIESIRKKGKIKSELGFGAMIGVISGGKEFNK